MPGLYAQLKALNESLTLNQKLSIAALGTVILFGILGFVYLLGLEPYQRLISDLDPADTQEVIRILEENQIEYELSGNAVNVQAEQIDEALLLIASAGLADRGRVGFEIFDKGSWNVTDFAEKINYRRALEGELERTIRSISEVKTARVHIAPEKEALYSQDKEAASASVLLGLRGTATLSQKKVDSIRNLVAAAVQGLHVDQVSILSDSGELLSRTEDDQLLSQTQIQLRQSLEDELTRKVRSILERAVGESRVEVRTSLALDFNQVQQKELIRDPVLVSEQWTRKGPNAADGVGGVPGFQANQGGATQTQTGTPEGGQATERKNYEFSTIERMLTSPTGSIERLSMAVIVDDKTVSVTDDQGAPEEKRESWQPEELEKLRGLVTSAVGFDASRGDQLTLENVPFQPSTEEQEALEEPGFLETYQPIVYPTLRIIGILMVFLLFYLLIFRPVKKRVFTYVDFESPRMLPGRGETAALAGGVGQLTGEDGSLEKVQALSDDETKDFQLREQIKEMAKENPEIVTSLVRQWINDRSEGNG